MRDRNIVVLYVVAVTSLTLLIGFIGKKGILSRVETVLLWLAMLSTSMIVLREAIL